MLLYRSLTFSLSINLKPNPNLSATALSTWDFTRFVLSRFRRDHCSQVAASLTFTTLLALVPLVTIVLNIVGKFPAFAGLIAKVRDFITANLLPQSSAKLIGVYMQQFSDNASRLTLLGGFFLAVTAIMLLYTIDRTFNRVWRVSRPRPLLRRALGYLSVLLVWPLFIGFSLTLTSYLLSFSLDATKSMPVVKLFLLGLLPLLLTTLAFSWLYFKIPNRAVRFSHALIGGTIAALLFELMKRGFATYVTNFPTYKLIYGAFASLPVFLLWLYLSWVVILLGAEIAASLHYLEGGAWKSNPSPEQRLYDALRALHAMRGAHLTGKRYLAPKDLQTLVPLGLDRIEHMLADFASAGIVRQLSGSDHYVFDQVAQKTLADVYRLIVLGQNGEGQNFHPANAHLVKIMRNLADDRAAQMNISLEALFSTMPDGTPSVRDADSILGEFK
jgi:membrane protein